MWHFEYNDYKIFLYISAVKRLIASKINVFVYVICDPGAQKQSLGYICSNSQQNIV